jgi:hypothetical protein
VNEPVTEPAKTEQVGVPVKTPAGIDSVQDRSPKLKSEPETEIGSPPLPLFGESMIAGVVTRNVVVAKSCGDGTMPPEIVTVWNPGVAAALMVKVPVSIPCASIEQVRVLKSGAGNGAMLDEQSAAAETYPPPEKVPVVPVPPSSGVITSEACTRNCATVVSPLVPVNFRVYRSVGKATLSGTTVKAQPGAIEPAESVHVIV